MSASARRPAWVATVVALAGLSAIGVAQGFPNRDAIEDNLTQRSSAALENNGIAGVQVTFVGRDGSLLVPSAAEVERAREIVSKVDGVRVVAARAVEGGAPQRGASVTITVDGSRVTVEGAVPDEAARNTLRALGESEKLIVDATRGDAGLAGLPAVVRALGGDAKGVTVALTEGQIVLVGTVTSQQVRDAAVAAAREAVAGRVIDRLQVGDGVQRALTDLPKVTFENDLATLTAEGQASVLQAAEILRANPTAKVRIEGHTDSNGTPESNQVLSQARAQAVLDALVAQGIAADRMSAVGFGETRLQSVGTTPEEHALNRRVEFFVVSS